jgi:hypothetical protein
LQPAPVYGALLRARIVWAGLVVGVGLAVVYVWSTWALPVVAMLAGSPKYRTHVTILTAVPLALAAACLWVGAVRGFLAVAGLSAVGRWAGRVAFAVSALLGALVMIAAVVLLTSE